MNQLSNYKTPIFVDGFGDLSIHFVHHKSGNSRAIPLLFIHGWPGSYMEASKMLKLLAGGKDGKGKERPVFDVVAPSLPNYCWSEGVRKVSCFGKFLFVC